jgi:acyl-coenzyme A thioesterase PaaI-like protein
MVLAMEGGCYGCGDDNPISLGLEFSRVDDVCVATFVPRAHHRGVPGFLHGGVAATVLDETMASLGFMLDGIHCVTATLELKYRKPVALNGSALRIEAWRDGGSGKARRRHTVHGRLLLADGVVAVEATGIFISMPPGTMAWEP